MIFLVDFLTYSMHRPDSVLSRAALALAVIFGSLFRGISADGRAVELHSFTQVSRVLGTGMPELSMQTEVGMRAQLWYH